MLKREQKRLFALISKGSRDIWELLDDDAKEVWDKFEEEMTKEIVK